MSQCLCRRHTLHFMSQFPTFESNTFVLRGIATTHMATAQFEPCIWMIFVGSLLHVLKTENFIFCQIFVPVVQCTVHTIQKDQSILPYPMTSPSSAATLYIWKAF